MIRIFRVASVTMALLATIACVGRPETFPVEIDTAWRDSGDPEEETGDTGDSGEPLGPRGGLSIAYTFDPGMLGVTSCEEAGLDVISVVLVPSFGAAREPIVFPCQGQELRVHDLAAGGWVATLVGGVAPAVTWESVPAAVSVLEGDTSAYTVSLVCDPNEVDDGCGGG